MSVLPTIILWDENPHTMVWDESKQGYFNQSGTQKMYRDDSQQREVTGHWNWAHDGNNKNGYLDLEPDGTFTTVWGNGTRWHEATDEEARLATEILAAKKAAELLDFPSDPSLDADPPADQEAFLAAHEGAIELNRATEAEFIKSSKGLLLIVKEFPKDGIVRLFPSEIHDDLLALSHRWDSPKLTFKTLCVCECEDGAVFYWWAKTQRGLRQCLLQIPNMAGHLWMDQICIPQDTESCKCAQIQFMGMLYTHATSVVSAMNGVGTTIERHEYFSRAWTQQEFSFGKVIFSPILEMSVKERCCFICESLQNCQTLRYAVEAAAHRVIDGGYWVRSAEEVRIQAFDDQIVDAHPELKQQVHELWDTDWYVDENTILERLIKFRRECKWDGSSILGPGPNNGSAAIANMFYVKCWMPKDQLFGTMGAAIYCFSKQSLDYTDTEGSYRRTLELLKIPMTIGPRTDGDSTAVQPFLSPLKWRENTPFGDPKEPGEVLRTATHYMRIPTNFPQRSQWGHHFTITYDLEVWKFEREGLPWLAIGAASTVENRGLVWMCIQSEKLSEHATFLASMVFKIAENSAMGFLAAGGANWRLQEDIKLLLKEIDDDDTYRVPESSWVLGGRFNWETRTPID